MLDTLNIAIREATELRHPPLTEYAPLTARSCRKSNATLVSKWGSEARFFEAQPLRMKKIFVGAWRLDKLHSLLTTSNKCSTRARMCDRLRNLFRSTSTTTPLRLTRWITLDTFIHGTISYIDLRDYSRRVGLRRFANAASCAAAIARVCRFTTGKRTHIACRGPNSALL